jgi:hypothetical protein
MVEMAVGRFPHEVSYLGDRAIEKTGRSYRRTNIPSGSSGWNTAGKGLVTTF